MCLSWLLCPCYLTIVCLVCRIYMDPVLMWSLGCRFSMGSRYWRLRCVGNFLQACFATWECDSNWRYKHESYTGEISKSVPAPCKEIVRAHVIDFFGFFFFSPIFWHIVLYISNSFFEAVSYRLAGGISYSSTRTNLYKSPFNYYSIADKEILLSLLNFNIVLLHAAL